MREDEVPDRQASDEASEGVVDLPVTGTEALSEPEATEIVPQESDVAEIVGEEISIAEPRPKISTANTISGGVQQGPIIQGRDIHVNIGNSALVNNQMGQAREVFLGALKHREEFVGNFLKQALQQANTTFRISMAFMTAGGLIVLVAAALALTHTHGGTAQPIALVSGLGGLLIGTSGAAFSLRADKARKHLAAQAERMHSQLIDERRFTEVAELLSGIKNADVNDRARVALALKLMNAPPEPSREDTPPDAR